LAKAFSKQCVQYFNDASLTFDIPLKPVGTAHQQKVWNATLGIEVGKTITYGEIAKTIKSINKCPCRMWCKIKGQSLKKPHHFLGLKWVVFYIIMDNPPIKTAK
jgi:hypothetical protein